MGIPDAEIADLKVGDIIYECEMGMNIQARVTEAPKETKTSEGRRVWEWEAVNAQNGEPIHYRLTEGLSHYGPRLYRSPQYTTIQGGKPVFNLVGAKPHLDREPIPDNHVDEKCRPGAGHDTCRYLMMGARGWSCGRLDPAAKPVIDDKVERGEFVARGDNCEGLVTI